jgi:predicted enzyme related to lactoylglutathione lyase
MAIPVVGIVLYVKNIPKVAAFYEQHFGFVARPSARAGWRLLVAPGGGCTLGLHQAAKSQKSGAAMKLVFAVEDLPGFIAACAKKALKFGAIHRAPGYEFANAKDPAGNSISISNRTFRPDPPADEPAATDE